MVSADDKFDGTYQTNIVVSSDGSTLYVPPGLFKSTCKIDITWFPFDDQLCDLKFGSWTYQGGEVKCIYLVLKRISIQLQVDLQMKTQEGADLSSFAKNGEWDLIGGENQSIFLY